MDFTTAPAVVISGQPTAIPAVVQPFPIGFTGSQYPYPPPPPQPQVNHHPDLIVLQQNGIYRLQHDIISACCESDKHHYELTNGFSVIMTGNKDHGPLFFYNPTTGMPVMEVGDAGAAFFSSRREVKVNAPPGHPAGLISRGGFLSNHFDIRDAQSGRVFICEERWSFLGTDSYPIKDAVTNIEVARIRKVDECFSLTVADPNVTAVQKALFLGLVVLKDTMNIERRRRHEQEMRMREANERRERERHHNHHHHGHHNHDHRHHGHHGRHNSTAPAASINSSAASINVPAAGIGASIQPMY